MPSSLDFSIRRLGEATLPSPVKLSTRIGDALANYVGDDERVLYNIDFNGIDDTDCLPPRGFLERAGPRERIVFDPASVHAGLITCGGLGGMERFISPPLTSACYDIPLQMHTAFDLITGAQTPTSKTFLADITVVERQSVADRGAAAGPSRATAPRTRTR